MLQHAINIPSTLTIIKLTLNAIRKLTEAEIPVWAIVLSWQRETLSQTNWRTQSVFLGVENDNFRIILKLTTLINILVAKM